MRFSTMTKADLKNRMVVECRNGEKYIVIGDKILSTKGHNWLLDYNEDLTSELGLPEYDIMKVYDKVFSLDFNKDMLELLWERKEVKEVTMSEVEEKFGCKVKIILNK